MDEREIVYEQVGNYTKYALVEMLINKHKKSFNSLNQIEEVADDIIDGNKSVVWQQAYNRVHAQKSIINWCLN